MAGQHWKVSVQFTQTALVRPNGDYPVNKYRMYYDDHAPPHFHAIYGGEEAQIGIEPIAVLQGNLPGRALSMVFEWAAIHQQELLGNWQRLRVDSVPVKIAPLR